MNTNRVKKVRKLKRVRLTRTVLSTIGTMIIIYGLWKLGRLLFDYKVYETTDNAQVEQYLSPVNVKVSGYIDKIYFKEHQFVHKGDTLLTIDDDELSLAVDEMRSRYAMSVSAADVSLSQWELARENVSTCDANIKEMKANIRQKEVDLQRYRNLLERKAATPIQVEQMATEVDVLKARLEALETQRTAAVIAVDRADRSYQNAKASVSVAEAVLGTAELNHSYTVVTAPCDGYLGRRSLEEGQLISAGQAITHILPDTEKWIIANYKETQIQYLRVGQDVTITIDGIRHKTFKGRIAAISEATGAKYSMVPTDNSAGNFVKIQQRIPVRIDFVDLTAEENEQLRAGMMASVSAKR